MLEQFGDGQWWVDLVRIMGIDVLLSGDNAVVIALASRSLPEPQRKWAIIGGASAAIVLRVLFATVIVWLLQIPYLRLVGGVLLIYIGVKLVVPESGGHGDGIQSRANLFGAIQTILVADAVMSLDNVVAIAAAARGRVSLIVLGLIISIPLIIYSSQVVLRVINRFSILVVLGGGLLGWIAGEIIVSDPAAQARLPLDAHLQEQIAKPLLALLVMAIGMVLARRARTREHDMGNLVSEERV